MNMTRQTIFAEVDIHKLFAPPWRQRFQFSGLGGQKKKCHVFVRDGGRYYEQTFMDSRSAVCLDGMWGKC
jgi:hypothetical protein